MLANTLYSWVLGLSRLFSSLRALLLALRAAGACSAGIQFFSAASASICMVVDAMESSASAFMQLCHCFLLSKQ